MKYQLDNEEQALALMRNLWPKIKDALNAGRQLTLEVKAAKRSCPQNDKYHAMIAEISQQAQHMGAKWSAEDWKRLLVDQFCKDAGISHGKVIPSLDSSGIVQLGFQTRDFTKEQASEFVEFLQAWAATNGVSLEKEM